MGDRGQLCLRDQIAVLLEATHRLKCLEAEAACVQVSCPCCRADLVEFGVGETRCVWRVRGGVRRLLPGTSTLSRVARVEKYRDRSITLDYDESAMERSMAWAHNPATHRSTALDVEMLRAHNGLRGRGFRR